MKKNIIIIILGLLIIIGTIIMGISLYTNSEMNSYGDYFLNILNGYNVENSNIDIIIKRWGVNYQEKYLLNDNDEFCILEDVLLYNDFITQMKEVDSLRADPFVVIENVVDITQIPFYDIFSKYYSSDNVEKDNRVFEKNNGYYIKYNDFSFVDGWDIIKYGNFVRYVSEEELGKDTFLQRQSKSPYSLLGVLKEDGLWKYEFFDSENNIPVTIEVNRTIWGVKSCSLVQN